MWWRDLSLAARLAGPIRYGEAEDSPGALSLGDQLTINKRLPPTRRSPLLLNNLPRLNQISQ